jgi:hypothetical protein
MPRIRAGSLDVNMPPRSTGLSPTTYLSMRRIAEEQLSTRMQRIMSFRILPTILLKVGNPTTTEPTFRTALVIFTNIGRHQADMLH